MRKFKLFKRAVKVDCVSKTSFRIKFVTSEIQVVNVALLWSQRQLESAHVASPCWVLLFASRTPGLADYISGKM